MDLNSIRMFVAVVQADSLSAAANSLGTPLPTLSRRVRDLERQLKVQLLVRSARGAKLTDAGTRLYEHASRGIEALLEAEQAVVSDQAPPERTLAAILAASVRAVVGFAGGLPAPLSGHPGIRLLDRTSLGNATGKSWLLSFSVELWRALPTMLREAISLRSTLRQAQSLAS
jgi:DNA-binding transcriptional LysR family regulator